MITVRHCISQSEALSVMLALQAAEIEGEILHENAIPVLQFASGGIQIQVADEDAERAVEVLREWDANREFVDENPESGS